MQNFFKIFTLVYSVGAMLVVGLTALTLTLLTRDIAIGCLTILFFTGAGLFRFYPWLTKNVIVKSCIIGLLILFFGRMLLGPGLLSALTDYSHTSKERLATALRGENNYLKSFTLQKNTAVYKKSASWKVTFTYAERIDRPITIKNLGVSAKQYGISYIEVLFPAKNASGEYMLGIFDSTSKKWWVPAEMLEQIKNPLSREEKTEDEEMFDLGAVAIPVSRNVVREGFVKIYLPATIKSGDNVEFLNFLYDMEEIRGIPASHGMAVSGFTVNGVGDLYMIVRPYGKVPDKIWAIIR